MIPATAHATWPSSWYIFSRRTPTALVSSSCDGGGVGGEKQIVDARVSILSMALSSALSFLLPPLTLDVIRFSAASTTPSLASTPMADPALEMASIAYST